MSNRKAIQTANAPAAIGPYSQGHFLIDPFDCAQGDNPGKVLPGLNGDVGNNL